MAELLLIALLVPIIAVCIWQCARVLRDTLDDERTADRSGGWIERKDNWPIYWEHVIRLVIGLMVLGLAVVVLILFAFAL